MRKVENKIVVVNFMLTKLCIEKGVVVGRERLSDLDGVLDTDLTNEIIEALHKAIK